MSIILPVDILIVRNYITMKCFTFTQVLSYLDVFLINYSNSNYFI